MANIDPNSAIGQTQDANNAFAEYFSGVYQALSTGGAPPEFSDFMAKLDFSELHRLSIVGQAGNGNYPGAAAVENIHQMAAVQREYGLLAKGKVQYYEDARQESRTESD